MGRREEETEREREREKERDERETLLVVPRSRVEPVKRCFVPATQYRIYTNTSPFRKKKMNFLF